ncbi:tyrosine-type recombinase/integrase [Dissulfurirhabdus thermomarina]|uniref:Tyrosine-type recombinase/integrase n=1 Tax=Dissulfurirhabdus thermomarina TaxID=1765737 RepID=A0A6N9TJ48_DISTH|nr:tyrosine-type recombinase/integrase [Dissulfurirhabdus thermomarina]NDY41275.1 tyrosine-type recombinase/integrase [Dissulfurirhabdus thermomarina]
MSVRPHPTKGEGWWVIDYYPQGRRGKRVRVPFQGTEGEARALELELRRGPQLQNLVAPAIKDLVPEWLRHCENNLAPSTCRDIVSALRVLVPFWGHLRPPQLTQGLAEQYKAARLREGVTRRTVNKELSYFSSLLTWATRNGHMHPLPFRIPKFPPRQTRPPIPRPLSPEQVTRLLEALEPHYRLPVLLMADVGLRKSEALRLEAEQVDLARGILWIRGKGNKERIVPITTDRLREALEVALQDHPTGPLTRNPRTGRPYDSLKKALDRAGRAAGIPQRVHHHLLRHTFCTQAMVAGLDPRAVQAIAGHSDPRVTQIYTHIAAEWLQAEARKFVTTPVTQKRKNAIKNNELRKAPITTNP